MKNPVCFTLALGLGFLASPALMAAEVEVKMLNRGDDGLMVFKPSLVKIQPGDTVHFKATDKGHNAASLKGMLPEGVVSFDSQMNKDLSLTFDKEGFYGYYCRPHFAMGMVGAVVVGKPVNMDAAKAATAKMPAKAKARFEKIFADLP